MEYPERIQRSIDYIELHLRTPLSNEVIAKQAYISVPHLYKIFPVMTGCTVGQYIRRRRLTASALDLLDTGKRVIDIAFDFQFESQESFIHAFKAMFGITPGDYRRTRGVIALYNPITINKLQHQGELTLQPDIIAKKFLLVGLEAEVDLRSDFTGILADLRVKLTENLDAIRNTVHPVRMAGLWLPFDDGSSEENIAKRRYFTGVEVTGAEDVPEDFIAMDLPESLFAVFREKTRGTMSRFAYVEWLPLSGYILNEDLMGDFEIFDDMDHCEVDDECDILLPVRVNRDDCSNPAATPS